jgi:hypothetical protein
MHRVRVAPDRSTQPSSHMLRFTRLFGSLAAAVLLSSCEATGAVEPISGGMQLAVTLETSVSAPSGAAPHLQFVGSNGVVEVVWDVEGPPCLLAEASALQAGPVIQIRIHRSGDPLAQCVAGNVAYHYVARTLEINPGRYDVRLVDETLGQKPRSVGRSLVLVRSAP